MIKYFTREIITTVGEVQQIDLLNGKTVYVRHGDQLVRVSICTLVKIGKEFHEIKNSRDNEEIDKNGIEENRQSLHPVIVDSEQKSMQQDLEQLVDQNQNEESLVENLEQVTTHAEHSDNLCAISNMPKTNDRIRYRLPREDWIVAVVTGRGRKTTGKNKHYFNIRNIDNGEELGIHLDKAEFQVLKESVSGQGLNEQSCGEGNDNVEVVQAVFIATEHQSDPEVLEATQKELENWTNLGVYNEIGDQGQRTISKN